MAIQSSHVTVSLGSSAMKILFLYWSKLFMQGAVRQRPQACNCFCTWLLINVYLLFCLGAVGAGEQSLVQDSLSLWYTICYWGYIHVVYVCLWSCVASAATYLNPQEDSSIYPPTPACYLLKWSNCATSICKKGRGFQYQCRVGVEASGPIRGRVSSELYSQRWAELPHGDASVSQGT